MRIAVVGLLAVLSCTVYAASDTDRLQQLQAATQACKAKRFKTLGEQDACVHEAYVKIYSDVVVRGTRYAEKNYKGLTKDQAQSKLIELKGEYETAPKGTYFKSSKKAGEVDRLSIMNEGWWIQTHILGARQTQGDPWFIECKDEAQTANFIRRCPLGKSGSR